VRVLLPLPDRDFDVTEVAVPWAILRDALGFQPPAPICLTGITRYCSRMPHMGRVSPRPRITGPVGPRPAPGRV